MQDAASFAKPSYQAQSSASSDRLLAPRNDLGNLVPAPKSVIHGKPESHVNPLPSRSTARLERIDMPDAGETTALGEFKPEEIAEFRRLAQVLGVRKREFDEQENHGTAIRPIYEDRGNVYDDHSWGNSMRASKGPEQLAPENKNNRHHSMSYGDHRDFYPLRPHHDTRHFDETHVRQRFQRQPVQSGRPSQRDNSQPGPRYLQEPQSLPSGAPPL